MANINERLAAVIQDRVEFYAEGGVHGRPLTDKTTGRQFGFYLFAVRDSVRSLIAEDPTLAAGASGSEISDATKVALLDYWMKHIAW